MQRLETQRLILRNFLISDVSDVYQYASDQQVGIPAGYIPHSDINETLSYVNKCINGNGTWAIVEKSSRKPIGNISLRPDTKRCNSFCLSVGYVLNKQYWGKGYATEALKAVLDYGFNKLGAYIISAVHYPFNVKSKRVMEKCGMKYEGCLRASSVVLENKIFDEMCYSITVDEYNKLYADVSTTIK